MLQCPLNFNAEFRFPKYTPIQEATMSDHTSEQTEEQRGDNFADACAAIAILALVVGTAVYWLAGMPS